MRKNAGKGEEAGKVVLGTEIPEFIEKSWG